MLSGAVKMAVWVIFLPDEQRGLVFSMRLTLAKSELWVDTRFVKLVPGMTVTAEIKTGKRRLIEYLMTSVFH